MSKKFLIVSFILLGAAAILIAVAFIWQNKKVIDEWNRFKSLKMSHLEKSGENGGENNKEKTIFSWNEEKEAYNKIQEGEAIEEVVQYRFFKKEESDIDKDGKPEEYILKDGIFRINEKNEQIWQSENNWWVDDFFLADSTGEGEININLSLWRKGSFGTSKPFWVKENDMRIRNHFFVYKFEDDSLKPVWHSSNLSVPNCEFLLADVDKDKKNELVVIEGEYTDDWSCQGNYVAVFKWQEWGFFNQWRSGPGLFKNLEIIEDNKEPLITVEGR